MSKRLRGLVSSVGCAGTTKCDRGKRTSDSDVRRENGESYNVGQRQGENQVQSDVGDETYLVGEPLDESRLPGRLQQEPLYCEGQSHAETFH